MYLTRIFQLALGSFIFALGMTSCVKDVDFDQAGDIALTPEIQSDLLIFEIDEKDFIDVNTGEVKKIIRDTVRLEFLDDDYIQNGLQSVEFSFRYRNSFPQSFSNTISFYSESNNLQHQIKFFTAAGSENNPAVTEKIELIEYERINVIKRSIKMIVEIEVLPSNDTFSGNLNFESKGLFSFQF